MNAPRELAQILSEWATVPQGNNVFELHGGDNIEAWRRLVRAMDLVAQIGRLLDAMDQSGRNTAHYRRAEAEWVKGVIVPGFVWGENQQDTTELVAQTTIDQLEALADYVDADLDRFKISTPNRAQSNQALDDLFDLVQDAEADLAANELRYALTLISEVRDMLNEGKAFDPLELVRRINELVGLVTAIADELDEQHKDTLAEKFRSAGRRVRPFVLWTSAFVAGALNVAANIKEISS